MALCGESRLVSWRLAQLAAQLAVAGGKERARNAAINIETAAAASGSISALFIENNGVSGKPHAAAQRNGKHRRKPRMAASAVSAWRGLRRKKERKKWRNGVASKRVSIGAARRGRQRRYGGINSAAAACGVI